MPIHIAIAGFLLIVTAMAWVVLTRLDGHDVGDKFPLGRLRPASSDGPEHQGGGNAGEGS